MAAPEALHGKRGPFSHVREWPPCTPKRTQGALPLDPAIASEQLEELRRLPNRLPARGEAALTLLYDLPLLLLSAAALPIL